MIKRRKNQNQLLEKEKLKNLPKKDKELQKKYNKLKLAGKF